MSAAVFEAPEIIEHHEVSYTRRVSRFSSSAERSASLGATRASRSCSGSASVDSRCLWYRRTCSSLSCLSAHGPSWPGRGEARECLTGALS